jgi:hypothetical protein
MLEPVLLVAGLGIFRALGVVGFYAVVGPATLVVTYPLESFITFLAAIPIIGLGLTAAVAANESFHWHMVYLILVGIAAVVAFALIAAGLAYLSSWGQWPALLSPLALFGLFAGDIIFMSAFFRSRLPKDWPLDVQWSVALGVVYGVLVGGGALFIWLDGRNNAAANTWVRPR